MKIVKILGGLGNQMFQYVFYQSLMQTFDDVKVDLSEFNNYKLHNSYELKSIFNLDSKEANFFQNFYLGGQNRDLISRMSKKIFGKRQTYYEQIDPSFFDHAIYSNHSSAYLEGYWQNRKYFVGVENKIYDFFTFPAFDDLENLRLRESIQASNASISVHVRRGDYLGNTLLGNICDISYYARAINFINQRFESVKYFVFSNDVQWCKQNLDFKNDVCFVENNVGINSFKDMQLMSICDHAIIANSSFSWWGAYLNKNEQKIIVTPSKWFNFEHDIDEIVGDWIKV